MSIELGPEPKPVDKLRFENLRGKVLHRVTTDDEEAGSELGSLGPLVGEHHRGQYDIVIGNPPWPSGTKLRNYGLVRTTVARIAAEREIKSIPAAAERSARSSFCVARNGVGKAQWPDCLRSSCPASVSAGGCMADARQSLFEALDVTSIINGVELGKRKFGRKILAPFCILFATNRVPGAGLVSV